MRIPYGILRLAWAILAIVAVAAAPSAADGDAADAERVLAAVRDAYGTAAIGDAAGFRLRGRILSVADGVSADVRMDVALEGSLRESVRYPDGTELRIVSGKLAWRGDEQRQKPAPREAADSMRLTLRQLLAPFDLAAAEPEAIAVDGTSEEGWTLVSLRGDDPLAVTYEVDPASGRVHRIRGVVEIDGRPVEVTVETGDFRDVDGILFPFRATRIVAGDVTSETVLTRVRLRTEFAPEVFGPSGSPGEI
jgi:hypothetical protein